MLPTISLGPLAIPSAGLVLLLGTWLALTVVERSARKLGQDGAATYTLGVVLVGAAFVGARLAFAALHWDSYLQNPLALVWPLNSGYSWPAGIIVGVAGGFFYGRARRLPAAATLDALAPGLLVGLITLSLADFLAGPGYGTTSNAPWAIDLYSVRRHPVQIYEILVALAGLGVWRAAFRERRFPGQLFLVAVAVTSAGWLFVAAYRSNAWLTAGGFHVLQIAALAVLLATVFLLGRRLTQAERPESTSSADEDAAAEPG